MRVVSATVLGLLLAAPALIAPAKAQGLGDVGRAIQDQIAPRREPERDRDAYERGRRDQEEARRREADIRRDERRRMEQQDRRRAVEFDRRDYRR